MTSCVHHVRLLSWDVDVLLHQADLGVKLRVLLRVIWTFLSMTRSRPLVGHFTYGTRWAVRRVRFSFTHPNAKRIVLLDMKVDGRRDEDAWQGVYTRLTRAPVGVLAVLEALSKGLGTNLREAFRYVTLERFADAVALSFRRANRFSLAPRNQIRVNLSREAERVLFGLFGTETPARLREFLTDLHGKNDGTAVLVTDPVDGWNLLWGWIDYDKLVAHVGVGSTDARLYIESCIPAVGLAPVLAAAQISTHATPR